jgi:hypothetical protein
MKLNWKGNGQSRAQHEKPLIRQRRLRSLESASRVVLEKIESRVLMTGLTSFTGGDIVVMRTGDATVSDSATTTNQAPVYLDEYTPAGVLVGSVAVTASGSNALTLPGAGDDQHQGVLSLSTNGNWLSFAGYDAAEGTGDANALSGPSEDQAVVGEVSNLASTLNTSTPVNAYDNGSDNPYIRGAYTNDGQEFWTFGKYAYSGATSNGGLNYVAGTGATATTTTVEGFADWRDIIAVNGQLYGGTGSSSVGAHGGYQVSTGEPTTNLGASLSNNTNITSYSGGQSASALAFADVTTSDSNAGTYTNGDNVLYTIGDQGVAGITKYYYDPTGNISNGATTGGTGCWLPANLQVALNANNVVNPTGLVATVDPTNSSWVDLTVSGTNGVYTYIDKSGDPTTGLTSNAFNLAFSAPTNEQFRGAAVVPDAPVITTQPTSQTVIVGNSVTFTANASNTPYAVQWEVSTDGGNTFTPISGATSTSYTINPTTNAQNGNVYECVFSNLGGTATTNPATLNVNLASYTPGDLVVLRGGDAAFPDTATATTEVPVSLDEYTPAGVYVGTVNVDATGDASTITIPGVGSFQHEGVLSDSTNGQLISFAGYNAAPSNTAGSAANTNASVGKNIGVVGEASTTLNTSTVVNSYGPGSSSPYIRGAVTNDGNEFYTFGKYATSGATSNGGLAYVSGTGASATTTTIEGFGDWRDIVIANGQLYGGTGSSSIGTHGPYQISTGEPTTNLGNSLSNNTLLGSYPGGQSASALAVLNLPGDVSTQNGLNVLYTIGDQSTPGIVKYYYNGTAWVTANLDVALNATNVVNPTGLIAVEDPTNPDWVDITVSGTNGIYSYVDKAGPSGAIPANAFTLVASSPANQQFYGTALAPQTVPIVTTSPSNSTVTAGSTATFTAAATSSSTASVQWYELAPGGTAYVPDTTDAGNTTTTLSVATTSADNGYKYEAIFSNSFASATTGVATLTVNSPPTILTNPSNAVVAVGGTAIFTATASGNPTPTVQWYEEAPGQTSFTADTTDAGNTTDSLQVVSSQTNAGYEYEAVFSNGIGSPATSSAATLTNLATFTPGDLVVLRGGNAAFPDTATATTEVPVSLDEYTTAGVYVGTVSVDASGDANTLTIPGVGSFQHEGVLSDSTNGQLLSFAGYNAAPSNTANSAANLTASVGKRVGLVGNTATSLNSSTVVNSYGTGSSGPYIRGAVTNDGNEFYTFGKYPSSGATSNGGLAYVSGTGPSATTTTIEGFADWRDIVIANGQLYGGTGSSSVGAHGPYQISTGEPTTNLGNSLSNNTLLGSYPGGQSASALALLDVPGDANLQNGLNVIYTIGDQSTPGIVKYYYNGSAWVTANLDVALNATNVVNPTGLIAVADPTNPNWVDITVSGTNGIYSYVDKGGPTGAIPANAFTLVVSSPTNEQFYGIALAPAANLPTWLSLNSQAQWNPTTQTLAVTGPSLITANPASSEPNITASGASALVTFFPTGGAAGTQFDIGGLSLTNGATASVFSLGAARTSSNYDDLVIGASGDTAAPTFTIDATSTLNLADNDLIDLYGSGSSPYAAIQGDIDHAADGGAWDQTGLTSSVAAANSATYGLGYAEASSLPSPENTSFDGVTLGGNAVVVKYTLLGDTQLRGTVGLGDYNNVLSNYGNGTSWTQGDFHYGGVVGLGDYNDVLNNFGGSVATVETGPSLGASLSTSADLSQSDLKLIVNTSTGDVSLLATQATALTGYSIDDASNNLLSDSAQLIGQGTSKTAADWATAADGGNEVAEGQANNGYAKHASRDDTIDLAAGGIIDLGDIYNTTVNNQDLAFGFAEANPITGSPVTGASLSGLVEYVGD